MKNKRLLSLIALLLACALAFAGCTNRPSEAAVPAAETTAEPEPSPSTTPESSAAPEASPTAKVTATPEPTATPEITPEPTPEPVYTNPLTGEVVDKDYGSRRPVAVMVECNYLNGALITQHGIAQADIIYEMEVEKITRNMAVFMDIEKAGEILPIRSARSYFVSAALAYDAVFVHRGQSADGAEFASTFLQYYVDNDNIDLSESVNAYRLNAWPYTGDHSFASTGELIGNFIGTAGTRLEHNTDSFDYGLRFTDNAAPTGGQAANAIRIVFPETKITNFTYEPDRGGYTGSMFGSVYADGNTNEVPVFQNVLVLATYTRVGVDAHWHTAMNTINCEGQGFFCNGGYCEPITWSRGGYNEPFRYFRADGSELELGVGKTYIAFIDGTWSVSFPA